jgi:hypothetical protein
MASLRRKRTCPYSIKCPRCHAEKRAPCKNSESNYRRIAHAERRREAKRRAHETLERTEHSL